MTQSARFIPFSDRYLVAIVLLLSSREEASMNTQTLTSEVVFRRSFVLTGLDGVQPPGTYRIQTYSELLDIPSAVAYRRLSTSIELHAQPAGIIRTATIDPLELEAALLRDAASDVVSTIAPTQDDANKVRLPRTSSAAAMHIAPEKMFAMRRNPVEWHRYVASREGIWQRWISLNATGLSWIALVLVGLWLMSAAAG
jgi:hypothetical protein